MSPPTNQRAPLPLFDQSERSALSSQSADHRRSPLSTRLSTDEATADGVERLASTRDRPPPPAR